MHKKSSVANPSGLVASRISVKNKLIFHLNITPKNITPKKIE